MAKKEEGQSPRRICPIRTVQTSPGAWCEPECRRERCAWWDSTAENCAVLTIASSLADIEGHLNYSQEIADEERREREEDYRS